MAKLIKRLFIFIILISTPIISYSNVIFENNDISLLDNRIRIDPEISRITFILNHLDKKSQIVLVQPDGTKLYHSRHPDSVAWVSTKRLEIITIDTPMPGPWQAVGQLDEENRIRLISDVSLRVKKWPEKIYSQEHLTTNIALFQGTKLMTDDAYMADAQLSISIKGTLQKQLFFYTDDGKNYDKYPFDGELTGHAIINLVPGSYLISIKTKNNVFVRAYNQDIKILPTPIKYNVTQTEIGGLNALFTFTIDDDQIDPASIVIYGLIKNSAGELIRSFSATSNGSNLNNNILTLEEELSLDLYQFTITAFATTLDGREIKVKLRDTNFTLRAPIRPVLLSDTDTINNIKIVPEKSVSFSWIFTIIVGSLTVIILSVLIFFFLKIRRSKVIVDQHENQEEL